jgi:adenine-specific DNA-methyltransferase
MTTTKSKKDLGQYFTVSDELQQFVFDNVKYKSCELLEPSFGAGHLLSKFTEYNKNYPMTCYELDDTIKQVVSFNKFQDCRYGDFTKEVIIKKFKTIIGNPPYVKTKKDTNLYIKFVELCYKYLDDDGEMIFIVPSDFIKATRASSIITEMTAAGSFTDFLFPNNERLFDNANIDVVVFRYEKGLKTKKSTVNGNVMFCNVNRGIITFSDYKVAGVPFEELFNIYVGIVSGRDEIYKVPFGNIDVQVDKDKVEKFIYTEVFPTDDVRINTHLETNKDILLGRKIKKFSEKNWFCWGAPRNISHIKKSWGRDCIYISTLTRNKQVAFSGKVQYFGGALLCLIPKKIDQNLDVIINYLNSDLFQLDYIYSGRFKIGHKQISTAILPKL